MVAALLATTGAAGATPSHPGGVPDTCPEVLSGRPTGGLEKVTSPPAGSEVRRGEVVEVVLRWNPGLFAGPVVHKALDCVTVDGHPADELSVQERDTANDGEFTTRVTVPEGLADGSRLCDRGFVSGPATPDTFGREKSNDVCFTVRGDTAVVTAPALGAPPAESSAGPPLPAAETAPAPTEAAGPVPAPSSVPTESTPAPLASPRPPTGLAAPGVTSPGQDESGLGPAGGGLPGTEVAGAGDTAGGRPSTLPRTGAPVSTTALAGLLALALGGLARLAGRRRPAAVRS